MGTLILVLLSVGIALPVGIASGIYMAEYADERIRNFFTILFDILAGIPSIVIGLFGFSVTIFLHNHFLEKLFPWLFISALSLAFLVLPYLIRTTQTAIESIPDNIRMTGIALGATHLQNIIYVLIPRSLPGIVSGIVLSIGRCAEDTAVIMLTGVVATAGIPKSVFAGYEALPFYIYYISSQYTDSEELMTGFSAAITLVSICALLFLLAFFIKQRLSSYMLYRS
ncbi:Phosphate uptake ABC transporter (fragment) [Desulfamplus magnetovallimortis]|uniref:Phosphate uptake ABC transporter n=1 Tax=Desulfamplus magnetovallimortis TaxID=1246637 RepID=A0A1W1HG07_9BACT